MKRSTCLLTFSLLFIFSLAQQTKKGKYGDGPDGVAAVGVIKGLSDEQLLETVQKQTFRFFLAWCTPGKWFGFGKKQYSAGRALLGLYQ